MDFPQQVQDVDSVIISPRSVLASVGNDCVQMVLGTSAAAAWPTANTAIFVPFVVSGQFLAQQMLVEIGAASGNIDVGIYDTGGHRLVSDGGHAQAGTNAVQSFDITDTLLRPGQYYLATAADNTTGTVFRTDGLTVGIAGMMGCLSMASAYPLPDPVTFASAIQYIPQIVLLGRSLV